MDSAAPPTLELPRAVPDAAGRRVLLVDDSELVHKLVGVWLRPEGVELLGATTAAGGVAEAKAFRPDLILLDVDLPDAGGFDVCRRLKDDPETADVPVVLLTGAAATEQKVRGLELGAVDYVAKPFHPAELRARVRAALRTKHLSDLLASAAQIDGLTGLRNGAYLGEQLAVARATLRRTGRPFGLAAFDVARLREANAAHGHAAGDEVLRRVAAALSQTCRAEDVACREGGGGFAVLTPGVGRPGVDRLAERACAAAASISLVRGGRAVPVALVAAVADASDDAAAGTVLDRARAALDRAKRAGGGSAPEYAMAG